MALKRCKECGNQVSEYANKCPKCGAPRSFFIDESNRASEEKTFELNHTGSDEDTHLPDESNPKNNRGMFWVWIIFSLVIIGGLIGYYVYSERARIMHQKELEQLRIDSIACAEKAAKALQDSIDKSDFRNNFISINDILKLVIDQYSNSLKIPDFRQDIESRLKDHGYVITDTRKGNRESEGGEYEPYTVTTWDKSWDHDDSIFLWSRVIIDDGCDGVTIEFCDNEALETFLESCRKFGYTHKSALRYGEYELTMESSNTDLSDRIHEFGHAVLYLKDKKIKIQRGCL